MPTNFYFNNYPINHITNEQLLVEDLVIEAMQIKGMDLYYMPRSNEEQDDYLYGDSSLKEYTRAYSMEMYLENVTGMDGEGDFISKFGLEIRDELTLLVSRRRFKFTTAGSNLIRPREGDLIYVPLIQNFFEITHVEHENDQAMFYTLGRGRDGNIYVYALKLKQYVFSNEIINTGIDEIDSEIRDHYSRTKISLTTGSGEFEQDEIIYQGTDLANATAQALVYTADTRVVSGKFVEIYRTIGNFVTGQVKGATSNAIYQASVVSDFVTLDNAFEDIVDNNRLKTEGDDILDWSESNPFGET